MEENKPEKEVMLCTEQQMILAKLDYIIKLIEGKK